MTPWSLLCSCRSTQCHLPFLFALAQAIMLAVMKKLTYDDEYNFENEVRLLSRISDILIQCQVYPILFFLFLKGEDEAMFVEYRKQLKMLLDRLAQVSPELLLESVHRIFTSTMQYDPPSPQTHTHSHASSLL